MKHNTSAEKKTTAKTIVCKECGAKLKENEISDRLCSPCKVHNMTIAILEYPISGAGEE